MKFFNKEQDRWPSPEFDENDQPHFLFIITPPYSGSTALSELINTSYRTMILQPSGEGQWLVPGLCEKDRWDSKKEVNYQSVKATWLSTYQRVNRLTKNIDVVIEKSPPNMMRMEQISSQFRDFSFIVNNRDPYAYCASILYRHHDADNLSPGKRKDILDSHSQRWIIRGQQIKELIARLNAPLLTYERFCMNPSLVLDVLNTPKGVSESINTNATVQVKDYESQPISNQNERQISKLNDEEIEHVSESLKSSSELLEYFGYKLLT